MKISHNVGMTPSRRVRAKFGIKNDAGLVVTTTHDIESRRAVMAGLQDLFSKVRLQPESERALNDLFTKLTEKHYGNNY